MMNKKIKIGILVDSYQIPAWAYCAIEKALNLEYVELCVVLLAEGKSPLQKQKILYRLYNKVDKKISAKKRKPDAFENRDLQSLIKNILVIKLTDSSQKNASEYFKQVDIEKVKTHHLDIIIKISDAILKGDILNTAKYGIWYYHHGDHKLSSHKPTGFWEVAKSCFETSCSLQILSENIEDEKVLYRSWLRTYPYSPSLNANTLYWVSVSFLARQIALLYTLGESDFFSHIKKFNPEINFYANQLHGLPTNLDILKLIPTITSKFFYRFVQKIFYIEQWALMFRLNENISSAFQTFKAITPPKDRFWADPHVIFHQDNYYIFIEELKYSNNKGFLSVIEMDQQGNYKNPVPILEKSYHLSYPFVFKWQEKFYMIPETADNKTIELYECIEFPYKWEFKMNLMENISAFDTTLFYQDGKWWLFSAIKENEGILRNDELFLFYADELCTTQWNPHPLNPVVSDIKNARPAGGVFVQDKKIFRPSQNGLIRYGCGFNINEINQLSEKDYSEKIVARIEPDWHNNIKGAHSFSHDHQLTVIDVFALRSRWF